MGQEVIEVLPPSLGMEFYRAVVDQRREEARGAVGRRPDRGGRRVRRALGLRLVSAGLRLIAEPGTGGADVRAIARR